MRSDELAAELNQCPFDPIRLSLADGAVVEISTPYLSFIQPAGWLYVARARRPLGGPDKNVEKVELIPVEQVSGVQREW
jgi:hypothetical protein